MSQKHLMELRAEVEDGSVCIHAYKSTWSFDEGKTGASDPFRVIRVYRRETPGFTFNDDYAEYFDGLSWREAELVFEGPLAAGNNRKFAYIDNDVVIGQTYAYWMAADEGEPVGPAPVKVRDPEVWWSQARIASEMVELKARYPQIVQVETIGRTVRGKEIQALRIGPARPCIGLVGAVHAGESGPELILPAIANLLANHGELLSRVGIVAVPVANADERERLARGVPWYLRTNANGVDLNRNFPSDWEDVSYSYGLDSSDPASATYRGVAPGSEPETQALMAFFNKNTVDVLYSYHFLASITGMRFLAPISTEGFVERAKQCQDFAVCYAGGMVPGLSFKTEQVFAYGTCGSSLPAWFHRQSGAPAFDIEISGLEPKARAQCVVDQTDQGLLHDYQERHERGLLAVLRELVARTED